MLKGSDMIGTTVSHYKILKPPGRGGMGVVYKAQDLKLERSVVLKLLPPDLTRDPEARRRFVHEAKASSTLHHTNTCVVHDMGERAATAFVKVTYDEPTVEAALMRAMLRKDSPRP